MYTRNYNNEQVSNIDTENEGWQQFPIMDGEHEVWPRGLGAKVNENVALYKYINLNIEHSDISRYAFQC